MKAVIGFITGLAVLSLNLALGLAVVSRIRPIARRVGLVHPDPILPRSGAVPVVPETNYANQP